MLDKDDAGVPTVEAFITTVEITHCRPSSYSTGGGGPFAWHDMLVPEH
jgi:hypothetical protein